MIKSYDFRLVDVFSDHPFGGNPLAVFTNAEGLQKQHMQNIARELNLSETTFVFPPRDSFNHFWVRTFTPIAELSMHGHQTIGTAYALALEKRSRRESQMRHVVFEDDEERRVSVTMESPMLTTRQTIPQKGPVVEDRAAIAAMLGLRPQDLVDSLPIQSFSSGIPYLFVPVADLESMQQIQFRNDIWYRVLRDSPHPHLFAFTLETVSTETMVHGRMFAPGLGVPEDPATGSAAGPLGVYLTRNGLFALYPQTIITCEQGIELGRPSIMHVIIYTEQNDIVQVRVGGQCVAMGEGSIMVDV